MKSPLHRFSAAARAWFESTFQAPTEVQRQGWAAVASGAHTLMTAPTGSGKTLAAFFWCLDRLLAEPAPAPAERCRVLYISPLKALAVDIEKNLRAPLVGLGLQASRLGLSAPQIAVAVRTGDTPAAERRELLRHPPDIMITTPESLFLMLTGSARELLRPVRWVIVDEIHAVASTKRGAHLALSLERLSALAVTDPQRIGLSATQRPLEEVARYLGGDRPVRIVDAGRARRMEVRVEVPVEDMANLDLGIEPELPGGSAAAMGTGAATPRRSIWPAIYPRLLELVRSHNSTILFVNSRRLAERLAARLNEMSVEQGGGELVKAHHGSISREQRSLIEDELKLGRLRGIVATSSLELGIDMGAVDLVLQVESPPSVAAGLQRVGRAGHSVGEISRGTVFPKYRADLLEAAAVVEGMNLGRIEPTVVPRNPLDVLAQQVVAMCALDEWTVDDLAALVRRAHPYRELGRRSLEAVLDMLSGRYPSEEFRDLRPRLTWDRLAGTLRGRAGAQRLAVTNAGTIPDRGLYTVHLLEDGRRVGELDEEMVFETRPGETFVLGASTWRVAEITASRVLVTPAPGEPGKLAFWHGDSLPRPADLGQELGRLVRELRAVPREAAEARLRERAGFDRRAAANLLNYLEDQARATGSVPDDRTIVVERFRDEVGDWRLCILTPFGARVHAPWALALQRRIRERLGLEAQSMHTDDGICLRLPDADRVPGFAELSIGPEEVGDLVRESLDGSALFAARFRENAGRALLLPRRHPGQRTPLWQQRQRSHSLLQVAVRHPDFPIVLETYRECLSDEFDLDRLRELLGSISSRRVRVVEVETERASPFASGLVFDYIGQFLYDGDAPIAERRAQALTLDRELLAELLGAEELRELISPQVLADAELELQGLLPERWPRDLDEAHDLLARLGDLADTELAARGVGREWIEELVRRRRAIRIRIAGAERLIAADDAGRYRDGLGVALPVGIAGEYLGPGSDPLESLCLRWALTHVPFPACEPARRWGTAEGAVTAALERLVRAGTLVQGEFRPGRPGQPEFCHPQVLRMLRRRSLAALRREVEAVPREALARFLPAWQGVGGQARGLDRLMEVIGQLQGVALPVSVIERDVLEARVTGYSPRLLDELVSMGEVVWVGRGALGAGDGRVSLLLREDAARLLPEPSLEPPAGDLHNAIRRHLAERGAVFFRELQQAVAGAEFQVLLDALWDLVWAGEVTNDTFMPLRGIGRGPVRLAAARAHRWRAPRPRLAGSLPITAGGRWSSVAGLADPAPSPTQRLHAVAESLLVRYGVLTREAVLAEGWSGGFAALYPVLRAMEEVGRVRRGYFVEGLGGSQFALPGSVDALRDHRERSEQVVLLSAVDPANAYGTILDWPAAGEGRPSRAAGAYVVLEAGLPRLYLERGGRSLITFGEPEPSHLALLAGLAARLGRLELQRVDGRPAFESPLAPKLLEAGFRSSPRGLVVWPPAGELARAR